MKHINVALFVPHKGCPHMCSFCNQKTISGTSGELTASDIDEAVRIATSKEYDKTNSEIAFFGGSFTAIDREYMTYLLESAYPYVEKGVFKGIRCSTRPDAIDDEVLTILKKYGVTAIELGAQSMDDEVLSMNDRGHTAEDVVKASEKIKKHGFELGLQMMTGLYGSTREKDIKTAEKLIELKPETVRIYPTVVLENTRLACLHRSGEYTPETTQEAVVNCSVILDMFNNAGIKVIRLGLHSGGNVEGGFVAGAFHPAFRELCESRIYFEKLRKYIEEEKIKGKITIYVCPSEISKMTGQKKGNILLLEQMGVYAGVRGDGSLGKYEFRAVREE
ncbi:MAG: radical SAM protein [Clostridia bacterium]|nr:radical SAM protein [Clostridia bacterium]